MLIIGTITEIQVNLQYKMFLLNVVKNTFENYNFEDLQYKMFLLNKHFSNITDSFKVIYNTKCFY